MRVTDHFLRVFFGCIFWRNSGVTYCLVRLYYCRLPISSFKAGCFPHMQIAPRGHGVRRPQGHGQFLCHVVVG